jgi:hypothetical protein
MKKAKLEGHVYSLSHDGMSAAEFDEAFSDLCRLFLVAPGDEWLESRHSFQQDLCGIQGPKWRVNTVRHA